MIEVTVFIRLREEAGLSQQALADMAGVSQQLIGEIEKGRTRTTKAIYRIAGALKVTADTLDPAVPPWDEEWGEIVANVRKLPEKEGRAIINKIKRDVQMKLKGTSLIS